MLPACAAGLRVVITPSANSAGAAVPEATLVLDDLLGFGPREGRVSVLDVTRVVTP